MAHDKKALGDGLTFVLDGPQGIEVVNDVPVGDANDAFADMTMQ
jgi:hypothetical protein